MLVVGSAPCLYEDVERALKLRPFASMMLVNGACTAFENAEHFLAGHEEKAEFFMRERRERFPNASPIRVHGCCHPHRKEMMKGMFPSVTDWHPHEMGVGATSASKAAKIALQMSYTEVVLCGCPMDQPGYFPGEAKVPQHVMCLRIGDHGNAFNLTKENGKPLPVQEARIIKGYRANLKLLAAGEFKNRVFSMSGFTREQLGSPPEDLK